jgi:hypothetical protein
MDEKIAPSAQPGTAMLSGSNPSPPKAVIKNIDMEKPQELKAIELATAGLAIYSMEKDLAEHLKREFDRQYGVTWHCVVGKK